MKIIEKVKKNLQKYLQRSGLLEEYNKAENILLETGHKKIIIADLAAGIGWSTFFLSKLPNVKKVYAVEIAKHKI